MRFITGLLLFITTIGSAATALADVSVVVLGLRTVDGDDAQAKTLTAAIREAAKQVPGWAVVDREVSIAQLSLAHGCEEVHASCLSDIAKGQGTDRLVYGAVRRTSAGDDYDFHLSLGLFDATAGSIEKTVAGDLPRSKVQADEAGELVTELVQRLTGATMPSTVVGTIFAGTIAIRSNVREARVILDGEYAGDLAEGRLLLERIQPGDHEIEVSADGYETHRATVPVQKGGQTAFAVNLESVQDETATHGRALEASYQLDTSGSGWPLAGTPLWVSYTLLGVSGASFLGMALSWVAISSAESEPVYEEYRTRIYEANERLGTGHQIEDVCVPAKKGLPYGLSGEEVNEVADLCYRADTFEVLQWVFLGTGVVTGGLGVYLLLVHEDPSDARASAGRAPLSLSPSVSPDSAKLSATLRF